MMALYLSSVNHILIYLTKKIVNALYTAVVSTSRNKNGKILKLPCFYFVPTQHSFRVLPCSYIGAFTIIPTRLV